MSIINVAPRLTETITVKRPTSHSSAGDWTYGASFSMPARIERNADETPDNEGRQANDSSTIITTQALQLGDVICLPENSSAVDDNFRRIATVKKHTALDGTVTHYTVTLA